MGMMPDLLLRRHGLSVAAWGSERACYLGSLEVRSGQAVLTAGALPRDDKPAPLAVPPWMSSRQAPQGSAARTPER